MKLAVALVSLSVLATPVLAEPVTLAPMAHNSLSRAPAQIASAPVMNQRGEVIGRVQRVVNDQDGRPAALSYLGRDGQLAVIAATAVGYDGQRNLVVTEDAPQRLASR